MRHMSGTHRVALDWLFHKIKLEPKIQIKYVDTQNQFADILNIGSFSRDEWNHLLRLFNMMTCAGSNSKNRTSKHEAHEPPAHDEDLPFLTKDFGNYSRLPNILSGSIEDKMC